MQSTHNPGSKRGDRRMLVVIWINNRLKADRQTESSGHRSDPLPHS